MVRRAVAWMLVILLLIPGALAQETAAEGNSVYGWSEGEQQRVLPGDYADEYIETPEDIIVAALEVYSWFTISPLDVDTGLMLSDGSAYRVADESLCSYDVMISLLKTMFSDEIITGMFGFGLYTVLDGMLFTTVGGGRGIDENICYVEYEEVLREEAKIVYNVTLYYYGEGTDELVPETFEFVRELIDEQWVFTQFVFFW